VRRSVVAQEKSRALPCLREGRFVRYAQSFDWLELYNDVTIYRPRFIRITLIPSG
jgi:hypothetical protein